MRVRSSLAGCAVLALSIIAAADAHALAHGRAANPRNTFEQATPQQMSQAAASMLTWADVTPAMKVAPGWEFTSKVDKPLTLELCTIAGKAVLTPPAPVMFQTELGETDLASDPIAFQQNIWQYSSEAAAKRAWVVLQKRAKLCTGSVVEATPGEAPNTQILSNGRTALTFDGAHGVWVHSYFTQQVSETAPTEGGYYVMFRNGDVIQSVEYDYPDTVNLSPKLRATVQRIAVDLATRWQTGMKRG